MRNSSPPRTYAYREPVIIGTEVTVVVKWFDPVRGFGFATPADGVADALIPGAVVQQARIKELPEGATLVVDLAEGRKGAQVSTIHSVDASTAQPKAPRGGHRSTGDRFGARGGDRPRENRYGSERSEGRGERSAPRRPEASGEATAMDGTVKWFNQSKGFGFIAPDDGGKDVFVHVRALERSGLAGLNDQQRVHMTVRQGEKGLEVVTLREE